MSDPRLQKFKTRQRVNQIAIGLSMAAMAFGLVWLIWILWETLWRGVGGLQLSVLSMRVNCRFFCWATVRRKQAFRNGIFRKGRNSKM